MGCSWQESQLLQETFCCQVQHCLVPLSLSLSSSFPSCLLVCASLSFQALHCSVKVLLGILIACSCVTMSQEQGFHSSLQLALLTYAPRWATGLWLFNVFFVTTCSFLTTVCCRVYLLLLLTIVAFDLLNFLFDRAGVRVCVLRGAGDGGWMRMKTGWSCAVWCMAFLIWFSTVLSLCVVWAGFINLYLLVSPIMLCMQLWTLYWINLWMELIELSHLTVFRYVDFFFFFF